MPLLAVGSGKSTLANAIPRLLDIKIDQLFVDGQDITQLKLLDLRSAIAMFLKRVFCLVPTLKIILLMVTQ